MTRTLPILSFWLMVHCSTGLLAQGIPIHGPVTDQAGKPLRGVRVELRPVLSEYAEGVQRLQGGGLQPPTAAAFSDAQGEFHLRAPQAGFWSLQVHAKGHVPMQYEFRQPLLCETQLPAVPLLPDVGAVATLTDGAGKPVSGAGVAVWSSSSLWREIRLKTAWTAAERRAVTDAQGRARIPRAPDEGLRWYAWKEDFMEARARSDDPEVQLRLLPALVRTVQVADEHGTPLANALVAGTSRWPQGLTSEQGLLSVALEFRPRSLLGVLLPDGRHAGVSAPLEDDPIVLEVGPVEQVSGQVVDRASVRPLAGALVWWSRGGGTAVQADSAGRFSIVRPNSRGQTYLQAAAPGYIAATQDAGTPEGRVGFLLSPGLQIAGRAVDSQGNPVAGARIEQRSGGTIRRPWSDSTRRSPLRTLSDGRFFLGPLISDRRLQLRILGQGFAPTVVEVPVEDRLAEVEVVLTRGAVLSGEVFGPQGAPLEGARVQAVGAAEPGSGYPYSTVGPEPGLLQAFSGSDGHFEVHHLPVGRFDVEVTAAGHAPTLLPSVEVGEDAAHLELGRVDMLPGTRFELRLTDPLGRPVEGAEIGIRLRSGMSPSNSLRRATSERKGVSDEQGRFVLLDLDPEERLDISVEHPDFAATALDEVPASSGQVSIALKTGARLFGRLIDHQGNPRPQVTLWMVSNIEGTSAGHSGTRPFSKTAKTDRNGRFDFDHVVPGKVSIQGFGSDKHLLDGVSVADGEVLGPLELAEKLDLTVTGRVLDAHGRPVASAEVRISRRVAENSTQAWTASSGLEGYFRIRRQEVGRAEISAFHPKLGSARREVEISEAENRFELTLVPDEPGQLRVLAVDEEGGPVSTAEVSLRQSRRSTSTVTDREGLCGFSDLEEGSYSLVVYKPGYAHAVREVDWNPSEAPLAPIEVTLSRGARLTGRLTGLSLRELAQAHITAENSEFTRFGKTPEGVIGHDGDYRIEGLAPGSWKIRIDLEGEQSRRLWETVDVAPGQEEIGLDFDISQGLELSVLVLHNGHPWPDAFYELVSDRMSLSGTSGSDGRILFEKLRPGNFSLMVGKDRLIERRDLELWEDRELVIDFKAATVEGLLLDARTHRPIIEAKLLAIPADSSHLTAPYFQPFKSDSEGRFKSPSLRPGRYLLKAYKSGYLFAQTEIAVKESAGDEQEMLLHPVEPIAFKLRVSSEDAPQQASFYLLDEQGRPAAWESVEREADGTFVTPLQAPAGMQLMVAAVGSAVIALGDAPSGGSEILLPRACQLDIRVPALAEGTRSSVVLRGPQGAAQPLVLRDFPSLYQGRAQIPILQEGIWQVEVRAEDGRTWSGSVTVSPDLPAEVVLN